MKQSLGDLLHARQRDARALFYEPSPHEEVLGPDDALLLFEHARLVAGE